MATAPSRHEISQPSGHDLAPRDDNGSDYGDLTAEEDELLSELVSRIAPWRPDQDHLPSTTTTTTTGTTGPARDGINHIETGPGRGTLHRVRHDEPPSLREPGLGRHEAGPAVVPAPVDGGHFPSRPVPLDKTDDGATMSARGEASPQTTATTTTTTTTTSAAAAAAPAPSTEPDHRSPLERFRLTRPLSVTDLVSPAWCELQYWYSLTLHGRKRRTAAMKQGSVVHQVLQDQVAPAVQVRTTTREDAWALRLWNAIQGLRLLRETGLTREMEVWGVVEGAVVVGVIDQLSYTCPDRVLEAEATFPGPVDPDPDAAPDDAGLPALQTTLDRYMRSCAAGSADATTTTPTSTPPPPPGPQHHQKIYLTDVKTRTSQVLPQTISFRPTLLQLMIYHRLLADLVSGAVDPAIIFARYRVDPAAPLTDAFLDEIQRLQDIDLFFSTATTLVSPLPSPSPQAPQPARAPITLHDLWALLQHHLRTTFPAGRASLSPVLQAEYRRAADGSLLGAKTFLYEDAVVAPYLAEELAWWAGRRPAIGVPVEEAYKCRSCEFANDCAWRQEKAQQAVYAYRSLALGAGAAKANTKSVV
ncbi:MAG: hypothetical protein M1826_002142 [Phylliscum demangeonii]|nr:MAG: hypothetical protein M1826_002142 [Phylliscum demangeonii]